MSQISKILDLMGVETVTAGTNLNNSGTAADVILNLDDMIVLTSVNATNVFTTSLTASSLGRGIVQSSAAGLLSSSEGTNGQILVSSSTGASAFANITSTGGTLAVTNGANTINVDITGTTDHALQLGNVSGSLTSLGLGDATKVLTSAGAGANPTWEAPTVGTVTSVSAGTNLSDSGTATDPIIDLDAAISGMTSVTFATGGSLQSDTTTAHTLLIQAYDVDGAAYKPFITLTNADDPTCDLDTGVTLGTKYIYRADGTDISIADGGTNASSMTNTYGVNYFDGTRIVTTAVGTATHVLTSNGVGVAPTFQAGAGTTFCSGAEAIAGTEGAKAVAPLTLKAKLGTQTSHGLLLGNGTTGAIAALAEASNGQLAIGSAGNNPTLATLTGEHGIEVTNAAGSVSIGNKLTINAQTGTSYTTVIGDQNKFITMTNAAASTLTIPPHSDVAYDVGCTLYVQQLGAGQLTLTPGAAVTFKSADDAYKLCKQNSCAAVVQTIQDQWAIVGDTEA